MRLHFRSLSLVLLSGLFVAPPLDQSATNPPPGHSGFGSVPSVIRPIASPFSAMRLSLSRYSPWRHRLKSVLEAKDLRGFEPVAIGRAERPDPIGVMIPAAPERISHPPLIPLRC